VADVRAREQDKREVGNQGLLGRNRSEKLRADYTSLEMMGVPE
jgi:hypothetical protein